MVGGLSTFNEKLANYDPAQIGRIASIAKALGVDSQSVRINQNGDDAAVIGFGRADAMAVLMPMRLGKHDNVLTDHDIRMITGVKDNAVSTAA